MFLSALRRLFVNHRCSVRRQDINRGRPRFRPVLDSLENRLVPSTLIVDDDLQQCPNADFTSIQAAVTAAEPGDKIHVCAGLYSEMVTVSKTLTLAGAGPAAQVRTGDPTREAVVQFSTPAGGIFNLLADDIVLEGFTIQGNALGTGVYTSPLFSGYEIDGNLIRDNVFGLYLNASGADESVVRRNAFRDNNRPGAANGNGIYSDQGARNALIDNNHFTQHQTAAMVFAGTQEDITVRNNRLVNDSSIVFFNTDDLLITHNHSTGHSGSGVFLSGTITDAVVSHNRLENGTSSGVVLTSVVGNVVVSHNLIRGGGGNGISLSNTSGHTIENNEIVGKQVDGIRLNNASNNIVRQNRSDNNGRDGIRVVGTSADNLISKNKMRGNAEHDAHDDTVGAGTAGTANIWENNLCETENRPGLCRHRGKP